MPLLEAQTKIGFSRETYKLPADVKADLESYCRFTDSDADHIVVESLKYVFGKDKAFSDWKKVNPVAASVEEISQRKNKQPKTNSASGSAA